LQPLVWGYKYFAYSPIFFIEKDFFMIYNIKKEIKMKVNIENIEDVLMKSLEDACGLCCVAVW